MRDVRWQSTIAPSVKEVPHKAGRVLDYLRQHGAPVRTSTLPWTTDQCDDAIHRGAHQSSHGEREFVASEMLEFCEQGYWLVAPYSAVRDLPGLRISPLGVVPQRDRRPRLIVDYTFSKVNEETVALAPREAMQFGRALQRVVQTIVHSNRRFGPVYLGKIDIADGFYRVWVQIRDIPKLAVVLPGAPHADPLVAFPLALPMGWVESPPFFTTLTETVCDLANAKLRESAHTSAPHRLEQAAATVVEPPPPPPPKAWRSQQQHRNPVAQQPVSAVDIYVDDFLLLAQTRHQRERVLRTTLHSIDDVFRKLEPSDPPHRKEPSSVKKLLKGDAAWSTRKRFLGWDLDTVEMTLNLPPHRLERLREVLAWIGPTRKRLPTAQWHQLLGELRSMSPALPGTRGLFSTLQAAIGKGDQRRVRITRHVRATATDFLALVDCLAARPTRLQELVPTAPMAIGACDACQIGMGGVWLSDDAPPALWRQRFAPTVPSALVTSTHRSGTVSISDLELAGIIAQKDVATQIFDVRENTLWIGSDNRAAVSWSTKGSSTSVTSRAYLLQYNALHQRHHRYVARHHYIPGQVNAMADDASRRWDLTDAELLTHLFNTCYPQSVSWRLHPLPSETNAALTGALLRRRQHNAFPVSAAPTPVPHGDSGTTSAPNFSSTRLTSDHKTPCLSSCYLPNDIAPVRSLPAVTLSDLGHWKTPYERLARRMPNWGPRTLA